MDDKGDIISSREVDKNLTLGVWTKDGSPRLSVENTAKKTGAKRKLIRFNWVERRDRKLSMSGEKKMQNITYEMPQLEPTLKAILDEYAVYSKFKVFYWKTLKLLINMVSAHVNVVDPAELALLPERKRFYLWIGDMTESREEVVYRPFFPMNAEEKSVLPSPESVRKLMSINHARWYRPLQIAAAAMLINFSYCGEDGSEIADLLWKPKHDDPLILKPDDPRLAKLGERLNLYIRHFNAVDKIGYEEAVYESVSELQKREYVRKRRFTVPIGAIGDVEYTVTLFEKEGEPTAVSCAPMSATARHERDLVFHIPPEILKKAGNDDVMKGGTPDEHFSMSALIKAKQCADWLERIAYFVSNFTGVKPKE